LLIVGIIFINNILIYNYIDVYALQFYQIYPFITSGGTDYMLCAGSFQ